MTERSPKIDIRPDHWEIVQGILKKYVPQHEVWAFGSRVKWTAKEYSDLDLAVITDKPLSLDVSASLSDDFSESDLPYKVDVVDWATTSDSFREIIERDRVVVQERGRSWVMRSKPFRELFSIPLRNGLTKPKAVRGSGTKMVNMGELFANPRLINVDMDRVPLNEAESKSSMLEPDDLLFARQSLVLSGAGKCSIFVCDGEEVCFESHVIRCRLNKDLADPHFYFYFFGSAAGRRLIETIVEQGAGASGIRGSDLAELSVPWVDPSVQRCIAQVLRHLDDKIDINRRINQTLEAMAQAIFKSWFVDFDPVKAKITAKAEGRDPLRAAMTAISGKPDAELETLPPDLFASIAATAALFPDEMEESELGEIPRGWKVSCISQFGDVVCGKTPSKANPEYFGVGIPFIKIPDMHNSMYVVKPSERLTPLGAASQARKTIPSSSICVSCIATVGKVVITHEPSQTNQQINSIVPKYSQYTAYLYFQMAEKEKEFHDLASAGSATLNMNTSTFSKVSVLMPNFEILTKFSALVAPLFSEILLRQKESAILSEIRDTLLPKLLSGELVVSAPTSVVAVGG